MRTFLAVDPGDGLRAALSDLAAEAPVGRAVIEENLHLTMAFLGEISEPEAEAVHLGMEAAPLPAITLDLRCLEIWGRAGVVVIRAVPDAALLSAHRIVAGVIRRAGLVPDRKRFRPHVTLLRLSARDPARLTGWLAARGAVRLPAADAPRLTFCQSRLHPGGARHEVLAAYPLGGPLVPPDGWG